MITVDEFTDKNGAKIELEDQAMFNDIKCVVCAIDLFRDEVCILGDGRKYPIWVKRDNVEIISIP